MLGSSKALPILAYHALRAIDQTNLPPQWSSSHAVSVTVFQEHLRSLKEGGWQTLLPSALEANEWVGLDKPIVLTFDDGHLSDVAAAELIMAYGYRAIFYIPIANLNSSWFIGRTEVANLTAQGFGIGSHGLTHSRLTDHLDLELWHELRRSKELLEDLIGKPVNDLAVPFGAYDRRVIRIANKVGYKRIVTSDIGVARPSKSAVLPRLPVTSRTTERDFERLLSLGAFGATFLRYSTAIPRRWRRLRSDV